MPTIKSVRPAGGGDYTTLAAWETFAGGEATADQWAECYSGNLGSCAIAAWASTPSASVYPRAYVADGHRHNGISPTTGAYISTPTGNGFSVNITYFRVEGLAITCAGGAINSLVFGRGSSNGLADGCLVVRTHATPTTPAIYVVEDIAALSGVVIRNCIARMDGANGSTYAIQLSTLGSFTGTYTVQNCTAYTKGTNHGIGVVTTAGTVNATITNCVAISTGGMSFRATGAGTENVTANNNASDDDTADDFGGSGHLINQTATDLFTDPANGDFTLKAGSNLIDAGANLSGSFTDDIIGTTRPQGAAFDIGAFELVQPSGGNLINGGLINRGLVNAGLL